MNPRALLKCPWHKDLVDFETSVGVGSSRIKSSSVGNIESVA